MPAQKFILLAEFLVLFVLLPLGFRLSPLRLPALPVLWLVAVYCFAVLRHDPTFTVDRLWRLRRFGGQALSILLLFVSGAILVGLGVYLYEPAMLFNLVRAHPGWWAAIMILYPPLSVYPQGLVYRVFLMHRYARMAGSRVALILMSAAAFAFMHLVFRNPLAVVLTFVGGLLFAWRYQRTGSLAVTSAEHALYGCYLFTVGLGRYFYDGPWR